MSVLDVLKLGRRWWWVLLLCPILAGGVAYIVSSAMTPIYRAQLTVLIEEREPSNTGSYNDVLAAERQTRTFSYLVTAYPVLEETIQRLESPLSPEALNSKVTVSAIRDTQLVAVSVTDPSRERAATIANTIGQVFVEQVDETEASTQVRIVERAVPPTSFVSPRILLNTAVAGLLGLLVAAGIVLLLGYLDDTVKNSDDVRRLTGKPALATIPLLQVTEGIETAINQRSPATESFRALRTNLQFASISHEIHMLVLTSARPGEGKTTTAVNLATVLAQGGQQVILVDGDLRKPRLHKLFNGLTNRTGLTNLLISDTVSDLDPYLQQTEITGVRVLTTGPLPPNPPDLLNSTAMHQLVDQLKPAADIVLIDSPPMAVTDSLIVAGLADGMLFVTLAGQMRSNVLIRVLQDLEPSGTPLLGIVMNQVDLVGEDYYYYYQSYYTAGSDGSDSRGKRPPSKKRGILTGRRVTSLLSWGPANIDDRGQ